MSREGLFGLFSEDSQQSKSDQQQGAENVNIDHNNLFFLLYGNQNNQADGNGQKSAENVDVYHSIVNHNYFLDNKWRQICK